MNRRHFVLGAASAAVGRVAGAGGCIGSGAIGILADAGNKAGWTRLFDGRTLTGWKANENPASFSVRDGMIVTHARGTAIRGQGAHPKSHLFYVGDDGKASFTDFEFQADVKSGTNSNSGIYFHTEFLENSWPQKGFEIQIDNLPAHPRKTGSLYAVADVSKTLVRDNEWFHLHLIVRDKRVVIKLDDKTVVDWTEPEGFVASHPPYYTERKLSRGTFALQAHDDDSEVLFKNILVKPLPAADHVRAAGNAR